MDWAILGILLANTGILVWLAYRLGAISKTVSFIEKNCPLFERSFYGKNSYR